MTTSSRTKCVILPTPLEWGSCTKLSRIKCVILPTPLEWGSCINLCHVSKATRGMHWGTTAKRYFNPFSPSQLSTPNFSSHNTYKIRQLVMRNWELIKANYLGLKVKFSHTCLMKSMGTSWENLTIQLGLKGLKDSLIFFYITPGVQTPKLSWGLPLFYQH